MRKLVFLYSRRYQKITTVLPTDVELRGYQGFGKLRLKSYFDLFFRLKKDEKGQILIDSCWLNLWVMVIHKFIFGTTLILRLRGNIYRENKEQKEFISFLLNSWALKKVDYIIVVSNYLKLVVIEQGIDLKKIFVLNPPNTLPVSSETRKCPKTNGYLLVITNFHYRSKIQILPDAINEIMDWLEKKGMNLKMIVVGGGKYQKEVQKLISTRHESHVEFVGVVDRRGVEKYLGGAILFLHFSNLESWGAVIQEAFAFGLPVIALNSGGVSEIVENGKNGFLVTSAHEVGGWILRLMTSNTEYQSFSDCARKSTDKWQPESLRENFKRILDQIYPSVDEKKSDNLLIVNDNHCEFDGNARFSNSTFHLFLRHFARIEVALSSPCLNRPNSTNELNIDGARVLPRLPYKTAAGFYLKTPFFLIYYFFHFLRLFREFDSILIVLPASSSPAAWLAALVLKKPVFCYLVGDVVQVVNQSNKSSNGLKKSFASLAAKWEAVFTHYLVRRIPTFVLGNRLYHKYHQVALNLRPAMTSLVESSRVRKPDSSQPNPVNKVITVSRLGKEKGIDIAIRAMVALNKEGLDFKYTIVGDGPIRKELADLVDKLNAGDHIFFHGRENDRKKLTELYQEADIFLLPSLSEGIPKVILEAMAASLSIVASDAGGIPDLIGENGERGWLIEPGSVESCKEALKKSLQNIELRNQKRMAAYEFILEHTAEKEAARIEDLILASN
jgi:glycosyltransferase involved in cell wall biosynthesis